MKFNRNAHPPVVPPAPEEKNKVKFNNNIHSRSEDHYDRITTRGPDACFVCDKKFKKNHTKIHVGPDLFRHEKCNCVSKPWYEKFHGCSGLISHLLKKKKGRSIESIIKPSEY